MAAFPDRGSTSPENPDGEAMLHAVYRAAERVSAELDLSRALEEIIACVRGPLGLDRAGVFLYRPRRQDLVRLIGVGTGGKIEHGPEESIPMADRRGPMQQVALGRLPYFHSHDVRRDVAAEVKMPSGLTAHAIVPLVNRGEILGVMAVDNLLSGRDIPEAMIRPLCLFAQFAALALGNALRARDLLRLNAKLRRLSELSGAFSANLRLDSLLREALSGVLELLCADRYAAWRRRSESGVECVVAHRLSTEYLEAAGALYRRLDGLPGDREAVSGVREPRYFVETRLRANLGRSAELLEREGIHSLFQLPLCHGAELLGWVDLYYDEPPDLSEHDWEIARLFGRHAGTALRNAELFEARTALDKQLQQANRELAADKQLLLAGQEELRRGEHLKNQFYRDVLFCLTNGKLVLSDREEIARDWTHDLAKVVITSTEDIKCCRDQVFECARAAGMSEDRVSDLCLCTSEAATNALKHAGGGEMRLSERGGVLRVRVTDMGRGIDALHLPHATLMRGFSTRASMGLGFTLMREMSDRICLATDASGTTLILEMAIHPQSEIDRTLAMLKAEEF